MGLPTRPSFHPPDRILSIKHRTPVSTSAAHCKRFPGDRGITYRRLCCPSLWPSAGCALLNAENAFCERTAPLLPAGPKPEAPESPPPSPLPPDVLFAITGGCVTAAGAPHPPPPPAVCWKTAGWRRFVFLWVEAPIPPPPPAPAVRWNTRGRIWFAYLRVAAPHPRLAPLTGAANEEERTQSVSDGSRFAQRPRSQREVAKKTFSQRVTPGTSEAQPAAQPRHGVPVPTAARRPSRTTAAAPHSAAPARSGGARAGRAHGGPVRAGSACGSGCAARPRSPEAPPDGRLARARRPTPGTSGPTAAPRSPRSRLRGAAPRGSSLLRLPAARYLGRGAPSGRWLARSGTCRRSGSDPAGRPGKWAWLHACRRPTAAAYRRQPPPTAANRRRVVIRLCDVNGRRDLTEGSRAAAETLTNTDGNTWQPAHGLACQQDARAASKKTHSPLNSPMWPVRKASGERRLTVHCRGLHEVTPPLSAAVPHTSQLQDDPDSKAAKRYATTDIAHAFFSIPLAAVCFHPEGRSVHLGPFAPGLETQPNRLPRVDPSGTGTRTAVLPSTCSTLTTLLCGAIQQRTCSSKESKYSKCFCMLVLLFSEAEQSERTCTGNSVPRSKTARWASSHPSGCGRQNHCCYL